MFTLSTTNWHIVRILFLIAPLFTLTSIGLALYTGIMWWLALAGLVSFMQIVFALTGYCPAAFVLDTLGVPHN